MTTQILKHFTFTLITKSFVVAIFFLFFSTSHVCAKVVINEVYPNPEDGKEEFIELYSDTETNLEGYVLSDLSNHSYTIKNKTIAANEYLVFYKSETSIPLNDSGDESVTLQDDKSSQIDKMTFGFTTKGKSWSRSPDKTGNFENNTDPTPGSANSTPPSPTPGSTATPTVAPTSQTTQSPTPTEETTPTETKAPTPTARESLTEPDVVLGLRNDISTPTPVDEESKDEVSQGSKKFPFVAIGFVTAGAGLMSAATIPAIKKKRMTNK